MIWCYLELLRPAPQLWGWVFFVFLLLLEPPLFQWAPGAEGEHLLSKQSSGVFLLWPVRMLSGVCGRHSLCIMKCYITFRPFNISNYLWPFNLEKNPSRALGAKVSFTVKWFIHKAVLTAQEGVVTLITVWLMGSLPGKVRWFWYRVQEDKWPLFSLNSFTRIGIKCLEGNYCWD